MALIKCSECGNEYSEYADKCPNCGCPTSMQPAGGFDIIEKVLIKYRGDERRKEAVIPNGVISIGKEAFFDCKSLTSITIPDSVISIGNHAFCGCESLTSINIPNNVISIGHGVFDNCYSLHFNEKGNALYLGNQSNKYHALVREKDISSLSCEIDANCKVIAGGSFSCRLYLGEVSRLFDINIPTGVVSIGDLAFDGCESLTSINIPNSVILIGKSAFNLCNSLHFNEKGNALYLGNQSNKYHALICVKDISFWSEIDEIDANCKVIAGGSFLCYLSLGEVSRFSHINIPTGIVSIGGSAFTNCKSLTSIIIPNSVISIGHGAFDNCTSLKTINCEAKSKPKGWDADWKYNNKAKVIWDYKPLIKKK